MAAQFTATKRAEAAAAGIVDALRQHFLAGPAFPNKEYIGIGLAVFPGGADHGCHCRGGPHHVLKGEFRYKAFVIYLFAYIAFQGLDLIDQLDVYNGTG